MLSNEQGNDVFASHNPLQAALRWLLDGTNMAILKTTHGQSGLTAFREANRMALIVCLSPALMPLCSISVMPIRHTAAPC